MSNSDPWANVPQSEINRELSVYFAKYPDVDTVWLEPTRYSESDGGAWTCVATAVFPYSNIHRRQYRRTFAQVY